MHQMTLFEVGQKKIMSFDLESAKVLPGEVKDIIEHMPLGIACAAAFATNDNPIYWHEPGKLTRDQARALVNDLMAFSLDHLIVTWNGTAFDFQVLAIESGMIDECAELALNHCDLMLQVTFQKGYYLSLNAAAIGMGLPGKTHEVKLNNGDILPEMSGAMAPKLWADQEFTAVLDYLTGDVMQLEALARAVMTHGFLKWTSKSGREQRVSIDQLRPVKKCFEYPVPDTSWMSSAPTRASFINWMPFAKIKELKTY